MWVLHGSSRFVVGAPAMNATVVTSSSEPTKLVEFNPALAAVIVAMVISFFVVGFATGMLKKCMPPAEDDDDDDRQRALKLQPGLDPEIVASLPFIQYKDLSPQLRESLDCSVCLASFDPNDCLRLLPKCSHVFHSHCIDAWFRSHNTCPLCRACLAEQDSVVVEFSEQGTPLSGPQERSDGASSATEERVNSHPFLQSKVEGTFKPAVRVGIAHEKAAAFVSIRRSNSTGTDFQFLRPSYVVDSEGTQHNRNYQTHAINVDELLSKGGAWFPSPDPDPEAGPSNPSLQRLWWTRWLRKA